MEVKSMREQLDEAWNKGTREAEESESGADDEEKEEERGPGEDTEEPVRTSEEEGEEDDAGTGDEELPEESEEADKGGGEEEVKGAKKPSKDDKVGDGDKSGDDKAGKKKDEKSDDELKAPVSWKPAAREHWAKLPKEAKEEIIRREGEIAKGLHQASGFRKVAEEYHRVVKPFEQLIRAQNSTPAQAITNMMTTASRLVLGTKVQKAAVVAEIMKNYDVDVKALDDILVGKKPDEGDDKVVKLLDEKLKPFQTLLEEVSGARREVQEKTDEEVNRELETFANDKKNEFFNDVIEDMADLMDLAAKRGQKMALKDAYDRACLMNPEISKVIQQRERAKKGRLDAERLKKKTDAASSIKGSKGDDSNNKPDATDLRSSLSQAWQDLEEAR